MTAVALAISLLLTADPAAGDASAQRAPIGRVATPAQAVAITFDACATRGGWYGFDRGVFEIVRHEQIPITIFVSGRWVDTHPDEMSALADDPLVEFGDHSYDHPHMTKLPDAQVLDQIDQTEAALGHYGRHSVAFRPPFGDIDRRVMDLVAERHLPTVTWDVVSGDPSAKVTAEGMVRTVVAGARSGSVIIFHINGRGWKTAQALPTILSGLRARGFRFVALSSLLAGKAGKPTRPVSPTAPPPFSSGPAPARR